MAVELNHTIVPAHDKEASAQFLSRLLGLHYVGNFAKFAVVKVNDQLTLDFQKEDDVPHHHYAFKVSDHEFDEIFARVRAERIVYGSSYRLLDDMTINSRRDGRGFYFRDPNGHILEVLTA